MSLCINYRCLHQNSPEAEHCQRCGTSLVLQNRFRAVSLLRPARQSLIAQIFEVVELPTMVSRVLRVLNSDDPELVTQLMLMSIALQHVQVPYPTTAFPRVEPTCFLEWTLGQSETKAYGIILEKIEGVRLDQWLNKHGPISQKVAIDWLIQLAEMAGHLHRHGFLHRDIKPENLFLRPDGKLTLIDFDTLCQMDLAYVARLDSQKVRLLSRTAALTPGTPGYAAPEQSEGRAVPASDFFSIGRTIVHLLTGQHPVDLPRNPHLQTLQWWHHAKQVDPLLANFIDRLMLPNPIDRPHEVDKIVEHLHELPMRFRQQRFWRSRPVQLGVGAAVFLGLAGLGRLGMTWYSTYQVNHYLVQADQMQASGDQNAARQFYAKALAHDPNNSTVRSSLALSCALAENFKCAEIEFTQALKIDPENVIAHYNLANVYEQTQRYDLAVQHYQKAARIGSPMRSDAINNLARMEILSGRYTVATEVLQSELKQSNSPAEQH